MSNPTFTPFLERNQAYAATHVPTPPLDVFLQRLASVGGKITFIIGCADPRAIPEYFLQLSVGEAVVARNAGGRAAEAMRSLYLIGSALPIGLVVVIHHTDCGASHSTEQSIKKHWGIEGKLENRADEDGFGCFNDFDQSVKDDMKLIREDKVFQQAGADVVGYMYDLETGKLREVV